MTADHEASVYATAEERAAIAEAIHDTTITEVVAVLTKIFETVGEVTGDLGVEVVRIWNIHSIMDGSSFIRDDGKWDNVLS